MTTINITGADARAFMDRAAQFYGGGLDSLRVTINEDSEQLILKVNGVHQAVANGEIVDDAADPVQTLLKMVDEYAAGHIGRPGTEREMLNHVMELLPQAYSKLLST